MPYDGRNTLKDSGLAVGEIVHDNRIISRSAEGNNGVAPDVAGSAGHEDDWFLMEGRDCISGFKGGQGLRRRRFRGCVLRTAALSGGRHSLGGTIRWFTAFDDRFGKGCGPPL